MLEVSSEIFIVVFRKETMAVSKIWSVLVLALVCISTAVSVRYINNGLFERYSKMKVKKITMIFDIYIFLISSPPEFFNDTVRININEVVLPGVKGLK